MRTFLRALAVSVALLSSLLAQKQSKHIVPSTAHELILPYVTLEPGWRTSLEVRNNLADRKILVAPSFRLSNGREIELPAVEIKSDETKSLNLATVVGGLNANLVGKTGTFGSVVLRFTSPSSGNIYAAAMVDRDGAPVAYHFDAVSVNTGYAAGAYEGLWWLPSDNVTALLVLTNSSEDLVTPELTWFGANGRSRERLEPLGPRQTRRIDVRSAITRAKIKSSFGGLQLSVTDHVGAIQLQHIMFDEIAGFSAIMRTAPHELTGKVTSHTLRAPMVALTTPDPALAFPSGTTLDSRIFIRNTTDDALPVVAQVNWRTDSATGLYRLRLERCKPRRPSSSICPLYKTTTPYPKRQPGQVFTFLIKADTVTWSPQVRPSLKHCVTALNPRSVKPSPVCGRAACGKWTVLITASSPPAMAAHNQPLSASHCLTLTVPVNTTSLIEN
jgi:hypothetical protein